MEQDANKMYQAPLGGPKRQNRNAQAREHALTMKKTEAESSSKITSEPTFQEIFHDIKKDWSSEPGQIVGLVLDQGDKDICWAICLFRLLQASYNMEHPTNHDEFSYNDLIGQIKLSHKESLALANLKKAFKHINNIGMLKTSTKGHAMIGDRGKRVQATFELYEDVDALYMQHRLDRFPVAVRFGVDNFFSSNLGEIYYLPKKKEIVANAPTLHCMFLIGYGYTKEGKLYFIGQTS